MNAPRSGSSYYTFRKPGHRPITIPKHEPIKKVYVEMVRLVKNHTPAFRETFPIMEVQGKIGKTGEIKCVT